MKIKRNSRMLVQRIHSTFMKNCSEHDDFRVANLKKKKHLLHLQTVYIADMWRSKLSFNKLKNTKPTINMGRIPVLSPVQVLALRIFFMGGCSRAEKSIGLFLHLLCLLCWLLNIQNA